MAIIEAEGLVKVFRSRKNEVRALDGLDLSVPEGTVVGLLGPNGAGKTTCVRIVSTLLRPDEGTCTVAGYDVVREAQQLRHVIGLSGQYAAVDENLTGSENLWLFGRLYQLASKEAHARAAELLEQFDLVDAADRVVKSDSGGMRRRLDLASAIIGRPRLLILDEPTTGSIRAAAWACGRSSAGLCATAPRCCSRRSTSRKPTSWPRTSWSSTTAGSSPTAPPTSSSDRSAASASRSTSAARTTSPSYKTCWAGTVRVRSS